MKFNDRKKDPFNYIIYKSASSQEHIYVNTHTHFKFYRRHTGNNIIVLNADDIPGLICFEKTIH